MIAITSYLLEMNHGKELTGYLEVMKGVEQEAKSYYEDDIKIERGSFLKMLLLDGCFVLAFLLRIREIVPPTVNLKVSKEDSDDYILNKETKTSTGKKHEISIEDFKSKMAPGQRAKTSMRKMKGGIVIDIDSKQVNEVDIQK